MATGFVEATVALLERTPRVLSELLRELPDSWLETPDVRTDGWTARDVVGHLITTETEVWGPRLHVLLEHGPAREFPPFDRFAHVERDRDQRLPQLLALFKATRAINLAYGPLRSLDDSMLDRRGLHPQFGEVTLRQFLSAWSVHDLDHLAQAHSSLAASRDVEVGPWKANLGILLRRDAVQ